MVKARPSRGTAFSRRGKPFAQSNRNASYTEGLQSDCRPCNCAPDARYRAARAA